MVVAAPPSEVTAAVPHWRPPPLWRFVLGLARVLVPLVCRLRVTGEVRAPYRDGPLILAGNHIGTFDPICLTAASHKLGLAPRMMATGGLFRAPVVGPLMRAAGHIPVHRGRETVAEAVPTAVSALAAGSVVFIYPEGRIGLDPALWPERAKTGLARLALASGAPVVPVATWGSHEVIAYHGRWAMLGTVVSAVWRRPVVTVHFGAPVDLSDLREGAVGHAQRASDRVMDALTAALADLRRAEPRLPRYVDPTRPVSDARVRDPARRQRSAG
jgi:1-acyl-sn-glycerol-3-phosphate acyltransferase